MKITNDIEITRKARILTGPWILYDGTCTICRRGESIFGNMMRRRLFRLETLQSDIGRQFVTDETDEMKVVTHGGRLIGGAEAMAYISQFVWWAIPLAWLWRIGFLNHILDRIYRHIAANRHCMNGKCQMAHLDRRTS